MYIADTMWTERINVHAVICDCGKKFLSAANYSLIECPNCGCREWAYANEQIWDTSISVIKIFINDFSKTNKS